MTEQDRLAALIELEVLDTAEEKEFDDLVRLAATICRTPISLVSLVDAERQWFKAALGLAAKETHRDISFCAHAIKQPDLFVVEDAEADSRFVTNALVTHAPYIRFYAGIPLQAPGGAPIGTLCVIDTVPRRLNPDQMEALRILGAQVQARMELRLKQRTLLKKQRELERSLERNNQLCTSLKATNDLFLSFMNNAPFAGYIKNADGSMAFYNHHLAQIFGVSEDAWIGLKDHEIWPLDMACKFREDDIRVLEGGVPIQSDDVTPALDGSFLYWKSFKFPYTAENGDLKLAGISIDVTSDVMGNAELDDAMREKNLLTSQLEASQHMFRSFMENSPNHAWVQDASGRLVFYNREASRFFGITPTEWLGRSMDEVLSGPEALRFQSQDEAVLASGTIFESIDEITGKDGRIRKLKSVKFSYTALDGKRMLARISEDITDKIRQSESLAQAHAELELIATTDFLTGLSTRRVFSFRAEAEFSHWTRHNSPFCILIMDLDNFKQRNDRFGHAAGDEALALVGQVLRNCLRTGDLAARMGGEEFGVLLPHTDLDGARGLCHTLPAIAPGTGPRSLAADRQRRHRRRNQGLHLLGTAALPRG